MKWLLIALVALGAIYGLLNLAGSRREAPQPYFPEFKAADAGKITLKSADGIVVLEKRGGGGGAWVVTSERGFPAEPEAVDRILEAVAGFSRKDVISSNPEKQALYQVDSTGVAVTIENEAGKVVADFVVGRLGPDYNSTYVRAAGSKDVILAPGHLNPVFSRGARSWQDKRIFAANPADLTEIRITKPGASLVLKRGEDGTWAMSEPAGAPLDPAKANRLARVLAGLRSDDFAGRAPMPEAGIDRADSSVSFRTVAGDEEKLVIGHSTPGGRFYASTGRSDIIYMMIAANVKALLPDPADLAPGAVPGGAGGAKPR